MKSTSHKKKPASAESIARRADAGKDVSQFFTNTGRRMEPIRRVNVDFAAPMLQELDRFAKELNVSRQAVIKTLIRQGLDQRHVGRKKSRATISTAQ
jgi:hypothetical protein